MINHLTGELFKQNSLIGKRAILNSCKIHNITIYDYYNKYFKNVSHEKHNRQLNVGERYFYKKISYENQTYEKVIVNENWHCLLCQKDNKEMYCASYPTFISHIKRFHHMDLEEYLIKNNFKFIKTDYKECGFCHKQADYKIQYNIQNKTYTKIYEYYSCSRSECKDNVCLQFFGKHYHECKTQYERIGGFTQYLKIVHNMTQEQLVLAGKSKKPKHPRNFNCSLDNYIKTYGVQEGTKKYYERNQKISFMQTLDGYIQKFGRDEGIRRYTERCQKVAKRNKQNKCTISKNQLMLYNELKLQNQDIQLEYVTIMGRIDIYDKKNNIIIEYYGDYWHCNPAVYADNFYNKTLQMTARQKHQFDKKRIKNLYTLLNSKKVIIIWEYSFNKLGMNQIIKHINKFIELQKEGILWI